MSEQDFVRINVGRHSIGVMGLGGLVEEMGASWLAKSDVEIREFMVERLSALNYIPTSARAEYGEAFLREYRKFMGRPVEEPPPALLDIKVLGQGCNQCDTLEQLLMEVLTETGLPGTIEHVRDIREIARFGVMGVPALLVNGRVVATGSVPTRAKLKGMIEEAGQRIGLVRKG